jgi:hypothetical protein
MKQNQNIGRGKKTVQGILTGTLLLLLLAHPAHADDLIIEDAPPPRKETFRDRIPDALINRDDSFFTFTIENDKFGKGTDENYTNGVRLTYYDTTTPSPQLLNTVEDILPFMDVNKTTSIYYSLGQNLYTPQNISTDTPDSEDRPYAAFLYGSIGATTIRENHVDELELTLGMVGPAALGEPTQKFVHELINTTDPQGWDHQLKNEPALMIAYQRQWPEMLKGEIGPFYTRLSPHAGFALGNVYTYGAFGATVQLLPEQHRWQAPPQRVRPAIPGSGYFYIPEDEFAWGLFAGFESRLMGRNIFLDGNSFTDSPSVDKKHFVTDLNAGVTLSYGRIQTAYTLNWRSEEFEEQDDNSLFGVFNVSYRF